MSRPVGVIETEERKSWLSYYNDTGCEFSKSCVHCQLLKCVEDMNKGERKRFNQLCGKA